MTVPIRLQRDMGCTLAEFERWLPGATRGARIESIGAMYRVHAAEGMLEIRLEEKPPRRIASISLPVLSVSFDFLEMPEESRKIFLDYFDHYTRRGGG